MDGDTGQDEDLALLLVPPQTPPAPDAGDDDSESRVTSPPRWSCLSSIVERSSVVEADDEDADMVVTIPIPIESAARVAAAAAARDDAIDDCPDCDVLKTLVDATEFAKIGGSVRDAVEVSVTGVLAIVVVLDVDNAAADVCTIRTICFFICRC